MTIEKFNGLSLTEKSTLIKDVIKNATCAPANDLVFGNKIINFWCNESGEIFKAEADVIPERFGKRIGNDISILFRHNKEKTNMEVFYKYGEVDKRNIAN